MNLNRRNFVRAMLPVITLVPAGCGSPAASRVFTDSLTLGTGRRGIDLTGETTVFSGDPVTIYWRVESAELLHDDDVEFSVDKSTGVGYEEVYSTTYSLTEQTEHVMIHSYLHIYGAGKFRARAIVPSTGNTFGPLDFNVA